MDSHYHPADPDLLIITSSGGLSDSLAVQFIHEIQQRIVEGLRKIIIDCSAMDFISSLDLSVLARIRSKIAVQGGDVKLCGVHGMVAEILQITRLEQIFEIHPDVETARAAFR